MSPLLLYAYFYPAALAGILLTVSFISDWAEHGIENSMGFGADVACIATFTFVPLLNIGASVFILWQWHYIARDWYHRIRKR